MKKLEMVDLKTQYEKISEEIDNAVLEVIRSTAFINGPVVQEFQSDLEKYLDVKHVIPCANGTDALQIALMAAGLEPGDEVITPSFTYIATAEVIALLQLKPVFVDVDPDTFLISPESVEKAISSKTKAIVPVHLYGQCAAMEEILAIAKEHNLAVIEDTAQALGADYFYQDGSHKKAGTLGDIGTTSFFPSKNLGCYGDGGAIFTNDDDLALKLRRIANHGQSSRYYHDMIGVNSRLDSIQAAILKVKLTHLNKYIQNRKTAASHYDSHLHKVPGITVPQRAEHSSHTYHQYTIKLKGINRNELQEFLSKKGIPSNIYYPLPIHRQKAFVDFGFKATELPVTEELTDQVLSLPIHTEMENDQLDYIVDSIIQFSKQKEIV